MPSDVIWAAAIAGGVGLAGNGATLWATQLQRRSQERVEAIKDKAEAEQALDERRATARNTRAKFYEDVYLALDDLEQTGTGPDGSDEEFSKVVARWRAVRGRARLVGSPEVVEAVAAVQGLLRTIAQEMPASGAPDDPLWKHYQAAYQRHEEALAPALTALVDAMRSDGLAGLLDSEA